MYITVTIPAIRTVVTPVVGVDTREDQIEAMRVLSAGNTLMMVLLGGVLTLQVSETACRWKLRIRTGGLFFFLTTLARAGWARMGSEIGSQRGGKSCG
jgi:ER membrane protein SH3